jgi:spermidine/putrescine transport system ATP-binding protein
MPPDLELRQVSKRFGDVVALASISLEIERGEFVTLLGPSGCGKTTTLRIVAGLEQESSGSVFIRGEMVNHIPPYRRNVNTVFQNYALFPHLSVFDNVAFGLKVKRLPRADIGRAVRQALEQVRLAGYDRRRPHELSGGQQQRVALARALVNQPAILLLDEPLGALDLKLRKEMQLELKRVHREVGITFIYVTHDQEEALTMSDRIAVMNAGQIIQLDSPFEVYECPRTTFVANFVGVSNMIEGVVCDRGDGNLAVAVNSHFQFQKAAENPPGLGQKVMLAVRPEKIRIGVGEAGLPGCIEDVIYLGSRATFVVRLIDGALLHAEDQADRIADKAIGIGRSVRVSWDPTDCQVFDPVHGRLVE